MTGAIQVFERPTFENLNARGYLLANRDLRDVFGNDESAACRHFTEYGYKEDFRVQLTTGFLASQREKFCRFKSTLYDCNADSFPVQFGTSFHKVAEYNSGESENGHPGQWVTELERNPNNLYCDIGAGLRSAVWLNCVTVEVYPSLTSDILIEPNCRLPFRDASLDGIGCFAVLEHVNKPWEMAQEIARTVKPGGKIHIAWPFLQPVHGSPSHYYNATREGLRTLFSAEFEINELYTDPWEGPDFTISWILNSLFNSIKDEDLRIRLSQMTVGELCKQPCSPLDQGDWWRAVLGALDDTSISTLSCGNRLIATRKYEGQAVR